MDADGTAAMMELHDILVALPAQLEQLRESPRAAARIGRKLVAVYDDAMRLLRLQPDSYRQFWDLRESPLMGKPGIDVLTERKAQWLIALANSWNTMLDEKRLALLPNVAPKLVGTLRHALRAADIMPTERQQSTARVLATTG